MASMNLGAVSKKNGLRIKKAILFIFSCDFKLLLVDMISQTKNGMRLALYCPCVVRTEEGEKPKMTGKCLTEFSGS